MNNTRFTVTIPYIHAVYLAHIQPLHSSSMSCIQTVLVSFSILSSHVHVWCTLILFTLEYPFLSLFSPLCIHTELSPFHIHGSLFIIIIIIIIIILGTASTNEHKYVIFGILSLTYFTQHDDIWFHSFSCK
jgi:hypothetical protein